MPFVCVCFWGRWCCLDLVFLLNQVVLFEVELKDRVFDGSEDEADVLRVRGAREVRVDDLLAIWIQVHEHLQDELSTCLSILLRTWKKEQFDLFSLDYEDLISAFKKDTVAVC